VSEAPDSRDEVLAALERTFGRGSARIEFSWEFSVDFEVSAWRSSWREPGSLVRRLGRQLGRQAAQVLWRLMLRLTRRWMRKMASQSAVGVLDFGAHRCMYGYPGKPEVTLVVGDEQWAGAPGAAVDALVASPASATQPLWLIDLARGIKEARGQGEEILKGHACRRFAGHADLNQAADAVSYPMALPMGIRQLDELTRIPVEVWIDREGLIRRIRHTDRQPHQTRPNTSTIELREFGVALPSDWSRLDSLQTEQPRPGREPT
jgi:hypothetical protein